MCCGTAQEEEEEDREQNTCAISRKRNLGSVNARKRRAAPPADTREASDPPCTCVSSLLFTLTASWAGGSIGLRGHAPGVLPFALTHR